MKKYCNANKYVGRPGVLEEAVRECGSHVVNNAQKRMTKEKSRMRLRKSRSWGGGGGARRRLLGQASRSVWARREKLPGEE